MASKEAYAKLSPTHLHFIWKQSLTSLHFDGMDLIPLTLSRTVVTGNGWNLRASWEEVEVKSDGAQNYSGCTKHSAGLA